ncbi:MAG: SUF system Fe-S cluster assembly protein [Gemmataceae bacterium]
MSEKRMNLSVLGEKPAAAESTPVELPPDATLEERVEATLKSIYDPELPVNIHDLGLIYDLQVSPTGEVSIRMTLTAPNCPVAGSLPGEVRNRVAAVPGVTSAKVDLVWDPPWTKDRMSEAAQLELGFF